MHNGSLIRIGSILRIDPEAGMARVHFPVDHTMADLAVENLEPVSSRFSGRTRVNVDPVRRRA